MRKKSRALVLSFQETTRAMAVEAYCQARGLPGRLIPLPREISAGCGLAWRAPPEEREALCAALSEAGLSWSGAYVLEI